jgi:hypothetical protein
MKRIPFILFLLVTTFLYPDTSNALSKNNCELPCHIQTGDWDIRIKMINYPSSELDSLWFRFENTDLNKENVTIEAVSVSPFVPLQVPLFNPIKIPLFNSEKEFVFQHYSEPTNSKQLQIHLSWNTYNKSNNESIFISLD